MNVCINTPMEGIRGCLCDVTRVNGADNLWRQRQITASGPCDMNWLAQSQSDPLLQE